MTQTDNIRGLIERIERASEGSRELDVAIGLAVGGFFLAEPRCPGDEPMIGYVDKDGSRVEPGNGAQDSLVPIYTAGIDAAMTLVPKGWGFSLAEMMGLPLERRWRCHLRDHNEPYNPATWAWVDKDCRTAPLAICAAALKAMETPNG